MKRMRVLLSAVLAFALPAQAVFTQTLLQEDANYFSLTGGLGTSNILIKGTSFGLFLDTNFLFIPQLAAGMRSSIHFSSDNITAMEAAAYARWYFWRPYVGLPFYQNPVAVFAQGGIGLLGAYRGTEAQNSRASFMFEAAGGVNIPLSGRWSIETGIRFGYPFISGFSIAAGYRFPSLQKTTVEHRELPPNEIIRKIIISQVEYIIFAANVAVYNNGLDASTRSLNDLIFNQIVKTLTEHPEFRLRIEGHANPVTNDPREAEELYRLSRERADEISRRLVSRGVNKEQIVLIAHGGARAVASAREDWSRNRRVELMVIQVNNESQEDSK